MDLLLDLNIVLDICVPVPEHAELALRALEKCRESGGKILDERVEIRCGRWRYSLGRLGDRKILP